MRVYKYFFFFSSRRRHTRCGRDWSSDVCSSDLLGTGAASLYAHVANKRELDQLMLDRAAEGLEIPDPDPEHWREQIAQVMRDMLRMMRAYPGVARAAIGQIPLGERSLAATERMLAILRAAGLPDQVIAYAADLIPLYVC